MNTKIFLVGALSTLSLTLLSGCANLTDQIAQKAAEMAVNQATNGQVKLDSANGSMTVKDEQGNTAQIGGGSQRPTSAPTDLPSLPGATAYGWIGAAEGGFLSFTVPGADYKAACDQELTMLKTAGWVDAKNGFNMELEGTKTSMYEKAGFTLTLSCSGDTDEKTTAIVLTKSKGNQAASAADAGTSAMVDANGALNDAAAAMKDAGSALKDAGVTLNAAGKIVTGN